MISELEKKELSEIYKNFNWTPIMKQWKSYKEEYIEKYGKNTIIFFQIGSFYETYFEDAIISSRVIGQALTSKNKKNKYAAPMSGSPIGNILTKINKLIEKKYNVILIKESKDEKENVKRKVSNIFTPGTFINTENYESKYIYSIINSPDKYTLSIFESTIGKLLFTEIKKGNENEFNSLLNLYETNEIIIDDYRIEKELKNIFQNREIYIEEEFRDGKINNELKDIIKDNILLIDSINNLFHYVGNIYNTDFNHIKTIEYINLKDSFIIDDITIRNLELLKNSEGKVENSVLDTIRETITPSGNRLLKEILIKPLLNKEKIEERLEVVTFFSDNEKLYLKLINKLHNIRDIERIANKLIVNNIKPHELILLSKTLENVLEMIFLLKETHIKENKYVKDFIGVDKEKLNEIIEYIKTAIKERDILLENNLNSNNFSYIKTGFSEEFDNLNNIINKFEEEKEKYKEELKKENKLEVNIKENNLDFFIEVKNKVKENIPDDWILIKKTKDTKRYKSKKLIDMYVKNQSNIEKKKRLELKLFNQIRIHLSKYVYDIQLLAKKVAYIDLFISFSTLSKNQNFTCPVINDNNGDIIIKKGFHPVIKRMKGFVSNDTNIINNNTHIITGVNMGGKSTYIRQIGIIVLLAHIGSYIPTKKGSIIGLVDGIYTRIGAYDNLSQGQSTFWIESSELSNILKRATNKSLVIIDELGRGTSYEDGYALGISVLLYFMKKKIRTLFATHFHKLTTLENKYGKYIKNYHFDIKDNTDNINKDIEFDHLIKEGGTNKSYGLEISEKAGVPKYIINLAKEVRKNNITF